MRALVLPLLVMTPLAPHAADPVAEVIAAERAFAAKAGATTTRTAFLEFLAPDSIMFRPGPVNGLEWFTARPEQPGTLEWGPDFVFAAASGDLAYSSGPWRFVDAEGRAVAFGHFATIWERQPDGRWKAKLDTGIAHDEMAVPAANSSVTMRPAPRRLKNRRSTLRKIHEQEALGAGTGETTLRLIYGRDARVLRDEHRPAQGWEGLKQGAFVPPRFTPKGGGASKAGDFIWSWGEYWEGRGTQGHYLHVWQPTRDGWRVVAAIYSPIPPTPPPAPESAPR